MKKYKPSYLYIKTHNKTGLKYFGKTSQDPYQYKGSGTRWIYHIKKYGYDVTTELLNNGNTYSTYEELSNAAIEFSFKNNIVESKDWANIIIESGDGGDTSMCYNYIIGINKRNISGNKNPMWGKQSVAKGKTYEELYGFKKASELRQMRIQAATGRKLSDESLRKMAVSISRSTKGIPKSEETKQKMRKPKTEEHKEKLRGRKPIIQCTYCSKYGGVSQMKRWHFDNCKSRI
jgi:hypothetical protein